MLLSTYLCTCFNSINVYFYCIYILYIHKYPRLESLELPLFLSHDIPC